MSKFVEIGEILESKPKDGQTKGDLYIKIKDDVKLTKGMYVNLEDPKAKFQRMLNSGKLDEKATDQVTEKMNNIPAFVKKILIAKFEE